MSKCHGTVFRGAYQQCGAGDVLSPGGESWRGDVPRGGRQVTMALPEMGLRLAAGLPVPPGDKSQSYIQ